MQFEFDFVFVFGVASIHRGPPGQTWKNARGQGKVQVPWIRAATITLGRTPEGQSTVQPAFIGAHRVKLEGNPKAT